VDTESVLLPSPSNSEGRINFLGTFASAAVEDAFRQRHFREDVWLCCFLVAAGTLRVSLFLLADIQFFGAGTAFWPLLVGRLLFLLVSAWAFFALYRASSPAAADRLFSCWAILLGTVTVCALSARLPDNNGFLLMSFVVALAAYCVTPLPLSQQAILALAYSAAVLSVSRGADSGTLLTVGVAYGLSNLFGVAMSWLLNRRRREAFLASLREEELRAGLEKAMAEIRTLRGLLSICAWCKRIRDEAQAWQAVEAYVQSHTHAAFTHGICPDCLHSQLGEAAQARR
jgi:hypothetical protein